MDASNELSTYSTVNTIAFLVLLIVVFLAARSILKLGKESNGRRNDRPAKKRFVELEKDYKWRRLKVLYMAGSVLVLLIVIGASYGADEIAPLQTWEDFDLERAEDRLVTITNLFITTFMLWAVYRFLLPRIYGYLVSLRNYLRAPKN